MNIQMRSRTVFTLHFLLSIPSSPQQYYATQKFRALSPRVRKTVKLHFMNRIHSPRFSFSHPPHAAPLQRIFVRGKLLYTKQFRKINKRVIEGMRESVWQQKDE